jgi:hypothetical protein
MNRTLNKPQSPQLKGAYSYSTSHTGHVRILEAFRNAASGLAEHPQDHGWRDLYRIFSHGLDRSAPNLTAAVLAHHSARPTSSEMSFDYEQHFNSIARGAATRGIDIQSLECSRLSHFELIGPNFLKDRLEGVLSTEADD